MTHLQVSFEEVASLVAQQLVTLGRLPENVDFVVDFQIGRTSNESELNFTWDGDAEVDGE